MAPPSKLSIATRSVERLVKDEKSYHKELEQQQARIEKYNNDPSDENSEYLLKQEQKALEETKKIFPTLRQNIKDALATLEEELESSKRSGGESATEEVTKATEAVTGAKKVIGETA